MYVTLCFVVVILFFRTFFHFCCFNYDISCEVKVTQSCLTLCDPVDYTVHGILQARILEWVAMLSSRGSSQTRDRTQVSRIAGGFLAEPPEKSYLGSIYVHLV